MNNSEISTQSTESEFLMKINRIFSFVLLGHIPISIVLAKVFQMNLLFSVTSSIAICSLPLFLTYATKHHKLTAISHGAAMMFFSGLLIHLSKGMIETHFHIFVSIASLTLFANPFVILAATVTIALHHLGFYFLLPESVFNYQASLTIVLIHAVFVIIETIPCMFIAKKFGDYIIKQGVVVQQIDTICVTMNQMVSNLKLSNESVARDTSLQTESVSKTADAINDISVKATSTSANAKESRIISSDTKTAASEGLNAMRELTESIKLIKSTNHQMVEQMELFDTQLTEIVESMKEIEAKTFFINDIVFQTKLLSFNASVESARAGEHGKGFAVVAEEVGNLATMSGSASKEINELVKRNVAKVIEISENSKGKVKIIFDKSAASIKDGETKTYMTTQRFENLKNFLTSLDNKVEKISIDSQEQTQGIGKIHSAMQELESVNERALKAQSTSHQVSEDLSLLTQDLSYLVEELVPDKDKKIAVS